MPEMRSSSCMWPMSPLGRATDGGVEDVLDVARIRVCESREDAGDDALDGEHREVADAQQQVAGEPEDAEPAVVAQEHAGDADQRQDGHQDLGGLADGNVGGDDVGDVGRRVVDLDADEDGAGGRGAEAGGSCEAVGGDVHVGLLGVRCRAGVRRCPGR